MAGSLTFNPDDGDSTFIKGGSDSTVIGNVADALKVTGTVVAVPTGSVTATYSSGIISLTLAASATDVFTLTGSATKTVRIQRVGLNLAGGGNNSHFQLVKRSTANSAGTSTTPAVVPHDSTSAAGTAVARAYTANPTLGTSLGLVRTGRLNSIIASATTAVDAQEIEFGFGTEQCLVLRGTSEVLAVNFAVVTTGSTGSFYIQWTEE